MQRGQFACERRDGILSKCVGDNSEQRSGDYAARLKQTSLPHAQTNNTEHFAVIHLQCVRVTLAIETMAEQCEIAVYMVTRMLAFRERMLSVGEFSRYLISSRTIPR